MLPEWKGRNEERLRSIGRKVFEESDEPEVGFEMPVDERLLSAREATMQMESTGRGKFERRLFDVSLLHPVATFFYNPLNILQYFSDPPKLLLSHLRILRVLDFALK